MDKTIRNRLPLFLALAAATAAIGLFAIGCPSFDDSDKEYEPSADDDADDDSDDDDDADDDDADDDDLDDDTGDDDADDDADPVPYDEDAIAIAFVYSGSDGGNHYLDDVAIAPAGGGDAVLEEGFEGEFPPAGWIVDMTNENSTWMINDEISHDGAQSAFVPGDIDQDEWLITPVLNEAKAGAGAYDLSFWTAGRASMVEMATMYVAYTCDGGLAWSEIYRYEDDGSTNDNTWYPKMTSFECTTTTTTTTTGTGSTTTTNTGSTTTTGTGSTTSTSATTTSTGGTTTTGATTTTTSSTTTTTMPPECVDNGNGTVTCATQGLMWAKLDNTANISHYDAVPYANNLTLGSHNDWRLPTRAELALIYDAGRNDSTPCGTAHSKAPLDLSCTKVWSSETFGVLPPQAYFMDFTTGVTGDDGRGQSAGYRALAVRGLP
ncbi:DUF1566 domain-containing protein [bacterium]|nr:DUF1566 domain-containing protein [bacterium]